VSSVETLPAEARPGVRAPVRAGRGALPRGSDHGTVGREHWYADAEQRLGRKLFPEERHIDIEAYDRDLRVGKLRLAAAIEKEKSRAIRAFLAGKPGWRPKITPEMAAALTWLYERGGAHALAEMRSMGIDTTEFAEPRFSKLLRKLFDQLGEMLGHIGFRIQREAPVIRARFDSGSLQGTVAKAMEKRVPGALDAASRLVSAAITNGLDDKYLDRIELFTQWRYTAVMDKGTCKSCSTLDGTLFPSRDALMKAIGGSWPNPNCAGDGRCRCRAVPIYDRPSQG